MNIINFAQLSDTLSTSGQPAAADFQSIAGQGFGTVINLALPSSDHALPDEGAIVTGLGMNYVHIPVRWEAPRVDQFQRFAGLLRQLDNEKVWVHCALNMRVSCFVYLYRRHELGWAEADARRHMDAIWDPRNYPAWAEFVDNVAADYSARR
ncbi:MAG: protein tyrosine phosphatase family protein [Gammaproteobacteria bacterium]|nr:protein tyrosine phosphatase family protein [Gammaproteobacteria bacterium]